jgi:hypothetical protein
MSECRCGRPTRDDRSICDDHLEQLDRALGDCTWLDEEIEVSMTKQRAVAYNGGGGKSSETAMPWHERAGDVRRSLHGLLVSWVRFASEEGVRGAPGSLPADNIPALSGWLLNVTDGLSLLDIGADAFDEITDAVAAVERVVFWKRKARVYLGPCAYQDVPENDCPGDVYATLGEPVGYCEECERGVTVAIRQAQLDDDMQGRILNASEIADWVVLMGLTSDRDKVRKRVAYWHRHERVRPARSEPNGNLPPVPFFRYRDVRPLLFREFGRHEAQSA